jgi:hypothetical protein
MKMKSIYGILFLSFIAMPILLSGCRSRTIEDEAAHLARHVTDELKMTDAQSAKLQGSLIKLLEKGKDLRDIRISMTEELAAQLRADQVDSDRLNEVITQNKVKLESMLAVLVDEFTQLHQDLTPEQRAEAASRIEKIQERFFSHQRWRG